MPPGDVSVEAVENGLKGVFGGVVEKNDLPAGYGGRS